MSPEILTTIISISGAVILAGATYWFTKKREREAELRREKLEHYKAFISSLSGVTEGGSEEGQRAFSQASNNLILVAPQSVLEAMQTYRHETRTSNPNPSREAHDQLLSKLLLEIRRDLGVSPGDIENTFKVSLWAANPPKKP